MWDSQSHKGRPIFGGWHKSSPNGSCGIGFTGFTTFVKFKMEEAWNSIVRWGPLGWYGHLWQRLLVMAYQVAPHGILLVPRASLCTVARNTAIYGNPQVNLGHPSRMVPLKRGQLAHAGATARPSGGSTCVVAYTNWKKLSYSIFDSVLHIHV